MYIGVGVGWQRRCKAWAINCVSSTTRAPFVCFCGGHRDGCLVRSCCAGWRTLTPRTRGMLASISVNMVRHPRGSYTVMPTAVCGEATPENKVTHWSLPSISKKVGTSPSLSPSYERFLEGCRSPFMRHAEHLTAIRAWCKQCLPGRLKPDVLRPGTVGMRSSMVLRPRPCTH